MFLSLKNILLGIGVAGGIGFLSGFIPAWTASRLDPVEAIRSV
jgi:putative ABC transport system permease protein